MREATARPGSFGMGMPRSLMPRSGDAAVSFTCAKCRQTGYDFVFFESGRNTVLPLCFRSSSYGDAPAFDGPVRVPTGHAIGCAVDFGAWQELRDALGDPRAPALRIWDFLVLPG